MTENKTKQMIQAAGEAIVRSNQRSVKIEDIILRGTGQPALFVASYLDSPDQLNRYFFYKDELTFPASLKSNLLAG